MKPEEYPNLLIRKKLVKPLEQLSEMLRNVQSHLKPDLASPLLRGAFVIAVSSFEIGLSDSLKYYLTQFPQKLNKEDLRFSKNEFMANYFRLLDAASEKYVISLSYKSFPEFFTRLIEIFSLDWSSENKELEAEVQEIRATRNLLLHNNLVVNDLYLEQAGDKKRSDSNESTLSFDCEYVQSSITKMLALNECLIESVNEKYQSYTVIAANRCLWKFLFTSPVMLYDDFWHLDVEKDHVFAYKTGKYEEVLSSTEILLLGLWRAHFNGNSDYLTNFNMKHLDRRRKEHVMFFLSVASEFSFE